MDSLDGEQPNRLVFVKREGEKYPGNVGHHPGTTMQEVLRALIERAVYVNRQTPCYETEEAITDMESALYFFETRAAIRHGREAKFREIPYYDVIAGKNKCPRCGHVGCLQDCH